MTRFLGSWSWPSAIVASLWLALGGIAWLAWGPVPQPIAFTGKVTVHPETIHQGGVVVMTREFVVQAPVALTVTRNLVPIGEPRRPVYALPESRVMWQPGRYDNPRAHEIPDYVVPGRYRFDAVASWPVNPLRTETKPLAPVEFTVVPK